jgi:ubiquinone/menaquinone biosynthesis C-methylase UbiE
VDTKQAYDRWAESYDTIINKTRDLEQAAAKSFLETANFSTVIEVGCGTGKNTVWIASKADQLLALDFSEAMMKVAKAKIIDDHVKFIQADITKPWNFGKATLVTCSLVLEHIENIGFIFEQVAESLHPGGLFYLCELHPYKQLQASRARFEYEGKLVELEYFIHHISDFVQAAQHNGLTCPKLQEWFDDDNRQTIPRLVSFLFEKAL